MTWREFSVLVAHKAKGQAMEAGRLTPQERDELYRVGQAAVDRETGRI